MKNKNKLLSLLLSLCMVMTTLSCVCFTASTATDEVILDPYAYLVDGDETNGKVISNGGYALTDLAYSKSGYAYGKRTQEYYSNAAGFQSSMMTFYPKLTAGDYMVYMCINGFDNESWARSGFQVNDNTWTDANFGKLADPVTYADFHALIVTDEDGYKWYPIGKYTFSGGYETDVVKAFTTAAGHGRSHVDALRFEKVVVEDVVYLDPYACLEEGDTTYGSVRMLNSGYTLTDVTALGFSSTNSAYNGRDKVYYADNKKSYGQYRMDFSPILSQATYKVSICINGWDSVGYSSGAVRMPGETEGTEYNWGMLGDPVAYPNYAARITTDEKGNKWFYLTTHQFTGSNDVISFFNVNNKQSFVDTLKFEKVDDSVLILDPYACLEEGDTSSGTVKMVNSGYALIDVATLGFSSTNTAYNGRDKVYYADNKKSCGQYRVDFAPNLLPSAYKVYICINGWDSVGYSFGGIKMTGDVDYVEYNWGKLGTLADYPDYAERITTDDNGNKWFYLKTTTFTGTFEDFVSIVNTKNVQSFADTIKFVKTTVEEVPEISAITLENEDGSALADTFTNGLKAYAAVTINQQGTAQDTMYLVIAQYSGTNKLESINMSTIVASEIVAGTPETRRTELTLSAGGYVKAFLLNAESFAPICEAVKQESK